MSALSSAQQVERRRQSRAECRDHSFGVSGAAKKARTDLGLALLHRVALPGICYTREEIAAWAGTTDGAIYEIEKRALRKLANHLTFRDHSARELLASLVERREPAQHRTFEE
jgi:hypothetical protein